MPDTQPLTDEAVEEILARDYTFIDRCGRQCVVLAVAERDALCAAVKQSRQQLTATREQFNISSTDHERDLQSQLEQLRAENEALKIIVDVGTNDDPGTALAKIRKIQSDAATAMRDKCVEKVKAIRDEWERATKPMLPIDVIESAETHYVDAADEIITALESLTLDPLEPEKQK